MAKKNVNKIIIERIAANSGGQMAEPDLQKAIERACDALNEVQEKLDFSSRSCADQFAAQMAFKLGIFTLLSVHGIATDTLDNEARILLLKTYYMATRGSHEPTLLPEVVDLAYCMVCGMRGPAPNWGGPGCPSFGADSNGKSPATSDENWARLLISELAPMFGLSLPFSDVNSGVCSMKSGLDCSDVALVLREVADGRQPLRLAVEAVVNAPQARIIQLCHEVEGTEPSSNLGRPKKIDIPK